MITTHDTEGRKILLNPAAIESIREAGPNSRGARSYIRTMTGNEISSDDYVYTLAKQIAAHEEKQA